MPRKPRTLQHSQNGSLTTRTKDRGVCVGLRLENNFGRTISERDAELVRQHTDRLEYITSYFKTGWPKDGGEVCNAMSQYYEKRHDYKQMLETLKKGSRQYNNKDCWYRLGMYCYTGYIVKKDMPLAEKCFNQAKALGHPQADKTLQELLKKRRAIEMEGSRMYTPPHSAPPHSALSQITIDARAAPSLPAKKSFVLMI